MSTHLKEATVSALHTLWWALHVEEADRYDRYRRAMHAEEDTSELDRAWTDAFMNKNKVESCLCIDYGQAVPTLHLDIRRVSMDTGDHAWMLATRRCTSEALVFEIGTRNQIIEHQDRFDAAWVERERKPHEPDYVVVFVAADARPWMII